MLIHNEKTQLSNINRCTNKDIIAMGGKNVLKICTLTSENKFTNFQILKGTKAKTRLGTTDLSFNPFYSNLLASSTLFYSQILLWDIEKSNLSNFSLKIGSHEQLINRINWSVKNPNLLSSCSQDKYIKIWDKNNAVKKELNDPLPIIKIESKERLRDCQFSQINENFLLSSYIDGQIKLWDLRKYSTPIKTFIQHMHDVLCLDWHPLLKNIFCSGGMDKNLYIWNIEEDSPFITYKTSDGISRVKWFNPNPQYIITSYQINNFWTNIWNVNIPNIPEFKFIGHKDVVTGFCWDISNKKFITCDKNGNIFMRYFNDGIRSLDNISTSLTKFSNENQLLYYHEDKPLRKDFFHCELSKLNGIKEKENKKSEIKILNLNNKNLTVFNNIPSNINYQIKLNSELNLDYNSNLQQYYSYDKSDIEIIFKDYVFILEGRSSIIKNNKLNIDQKASYTEKVQSAIIYNYNYAKNELKNYNHISIWDELKFLSLQESFKLIDNINNSKEDKKSVDLFIEITKNNILTIIDYLIDYHNDIYLATIISFLFHPILEKDEKIKERLIRMEYDCRESLLKLKLYIEANKIKKFSFKEISINQREQIFAIICNKCSTLYDATKVGKCSSCSGTIICSGCKKIVNGLFVWCSDCGHGGHSDCLQQCFKDNNKCNFCGHNCS